MMHKKVAKEVLKELKEKYPTIDKITVQYEGSGDSFGDFWDYEFEYAEGAPELSGQEEEKAKEEIMNAFDDEIWDLMDKAGANFNDDGSEGHVYIDLKNLNVSADCYEKYTETRYSGEAHLIAKK